MTTPKRSRTALCKFDELNVKKLTLNDANEPTLADAVPRIVLTTACNFLQVKWGFDLSGRYEKPKFLLPDSPTNWLTLTVELLEPQLKFIQSFDNKCKNLYAAKHPGIEWLPIVKPDDHALKVRVYFDTIGTHIKIFDEASPLGVFPLIDANHARELMTKHNGFRGADAKLVVKPFRIWEFEGKAGIKLVAAELNLHPNTEPFEEALDGEW